MTQSQKPDRRLDSKKQSAKNGQGTLALSSDHTATNRVAQPSLDDLAVGQIDGQRRLEPRHATQQPEIMEWRREAFAAVTQELAAARRKWRAPRANPEALRRWASAHPHTLGRPVGWG